MRKNLLNMRLSKGLTQTKLATKIGVTNKMISAIERVNKNPSWVTAQKLARYFNVPVEELLQEEINEQKKRGET